MARKQKTQGMLMTVLVVLGIVALAGVIGGQFGLFNSQASVLVDAETGEPIAPWSNTLVEYNLVLSDAFTGADANAVVKVYDEKPEDFDNPRGTFDDASMYTQYTASSGVANINKEKPGTYYAVIELSGYNTEFMEFTIPDGSGRNLPINDYNANPDSESVELSAVGTTTDADFAFTLVNDTSAEEDDQVLLKVADDTEFRAWKAIIDDQEGFSTDTDGDGIYDEGISKLEVTIGSQTVVLFDPNKGIDLFDSNDEYTMDLLGVSVADGSRLTVAVSIEAITSDAIGANDEAWGEGEGVLGQIKIYDNEANLFATVDITA